MSNLKQWCGLWWIGILGFPYLHAMPNPCALMLVSEDPQSIQAAVAHLGENDFHKKTRLRRGRAVVTIYQLKEDVKRANEVRVEASRMLSLALPTWGAPAFYPTVAQPTQIRRQGPTWGRDYEMEQHRRAEREAARRERTLSGLRNRWEICLNKDLNGATIHTVELQSRDPGTTQAAGALVCFAVGLHTGSPIATGLAKRLARDAFVKAIKATIAGSRSIALSSYLSGLLSSYDGEVHVAIIADGFSNIDRISSYMERFLGFQIQP